MPGPKSFIFALALIVTAAVTGPGPGCAHAQPVIGAWIVEADVENVGTFDSRNFKAWTSKQACETAISGMNEQLVAAADPDPAVLPPPTRPEADPEVERQIAMLLMSAIQANDGKVPLVVLTCKVMGVPA